MKKIIITGGSGFVGTNLINYLQHKNIGAIISLNMRIQLPDSLPDADAIIHLAGKAHDIKKISNPKEYFEVNYEKTKALFDSFLTSEVGDFIYFSSVKSVADSIDGELTEEHIPDPKTLYGLSKQKAEKYLLSRILPEGKRLFILRPCMIHGPGNKGNLNLLYNVVKKGIPYPLGAFENKRSFLSIDNLLYILERIITNKNINGGVYNVADDETLSTNSLIKIIAKSSLSSGRVWYIPKKMIASVAKFGDKLHLPLNSERLKKLTESYMVSNFKIKNALNITSLPITTEQGLAKTIKSFQSK